MSDVGTEEPSRTTDAVVDANDGPQRRGTHVALEGLSKRYPGGSGDWAVRGLSAEVARGEFFGLLGPSGCGKTTTLNMIAGFLVPSEGAIRIAGRDVAAVPAHQRGTAMVFQDYGLFPHLSARDNVAYGLKIRRVSKTERHRRADELLDLVGLSGHGGRRPEALSGGQRQRVAIARALAIDPDIVLLDEPLSNLDERLRGQVREELSGILRGAGVTVVLVTHDQNEAFGLCDRVGVMLDGEIREVAEPHQLYRAPSTHEVASFIGESNFLDAREVRRIDDETVSVTVTIGGTRRPTHARWTSPRTTPLGTQGTIQVRPEWLELARGTSGDADPTGLVRERVFQGALVDYYVDVAGAVLLSRQLSSAPLFDVGDEVAVRWADGVPVYFPSSPEGSSGTTPR